MAETPDQPDADRQTPADGGRSSGGDPRAQAATVAALALAVGKTVAEAAAEAGIGERTLYSWRRKTSFKRRVDELRSALVGAAVGRLSMNMGAASDALVALLKNRNPMVKLRASRAVIELGTKLRESEELAERLADIEAQLAEQDSQKRGRR